MTAHDDTPPRRPWLRALAVLGFWTLVGVLSGLQSAILGRMEGEDVPLLAATLRSVPPWWFWALATPAVRWMARRFPLEGDHWPASLAAHAGGALVATALHAAWVGTFFWAIGATAAMTETVAEYLRLVFVSRLYLDLLTYGAVLGAVYAFEYHDRFQERRLRASRLEAQLAHARLDALRMQLNPHFLFNALNTVAAQVRAGRAGVATSMLSGLGELLRYVLDSEPAAVVPLRQERAFLERYLQIERARFADRLQVEIDLPEALEGACVPSLLLQPLAENAVRHGIAPREGPGRIEITARRSGERLVLTVRDDGVGPGGASSGANGVGLANTRARLTELYGPRHRFTIGPREGGGTEVVVEIPWRTAR